MEVVKFIKNGGVMMYPLIICSIGLIALIIERFISLRKASADGDSLLDQIKEVTKGNPTGETAKAIAVCQANGSPLGRMFARGLKNAQRSPDAIEMAMEQEASNDIQTLD